MRLFVFFATLFSFTISMAQDKIISTQATGIITIEEGSGLYFEKCLIGGDNGFFQIIPNIGCIKKRDLKIVKKSITRCEVERDNNDLILEVFNGERSLNSYTLPGFYSVDQQVYSHTSKEPYGQWDTGIEFSLDWIGGEISVETSSLVTKFDTELDEDNKFESIKILRKTDPTFLPLGTSAGKTIDNFQCIFK